MPVPAQRQTSCIRIDYSPPRNTRQPFASHACCCACCTMVRSITVPPPEIKITMFFKSTLNYSIISINYRATLYPVSSCWDGIAKRKEIFTHTTSADGRRSCQKIPDAYSNQSPAPVSNAPNFANAGIRMVSRMAKVRGDAQRYLGLTF